MEEGYEKFKIEEYEHWSVYLFENQSYLGRCYIWSHRRGLVDFMDTNEMERAEFFRIGTELKKALHELFQPNLFNWASLGNISNQCHIHVVPRYQTPRQFKGEKFIDHQWGKNWSPYDKSFQTTNTRNIIRTISEQLTGKLAKFRKRIRKLHLSELHQFLIEHPLDKLGEAKSIILEEELL